MSGRAVIELPVPADPPRVGSAPTGPVPLGPADYRRRIRRFGPLVALTAPTAALVVAIAVFRFVPCTGKSCAVAHGPGWLLAFGALPASVPAGLPWQSGAASVLIAVVASIAIWLTLGAWAARRATTSAIADWSDWRREYRWLAVPLCLGSLVGAAALGVILLA